MNRSLPAPAADVALLLARVVLGVVLFAHGWQKVILNGIGETSGQFETIGIPLAIVSASFVTVVEFVGGVLLVAGALTTVVVGLHLVVMVGAASFVHVANGIFAQDGGWELVGVIAALELALAAAGAGRFSVDRLVTTRRARQAARPSTRDTAAAATAAPITEAFAPAPAPSSSMPALPRRVPNPQD